MMLTKHLTEKRYGGSMGEDCRKGRYFPEEWIKLHQGREFQVDGIARSKAW